MSNQRLYVKVATDIIEQVRQQQIRVGERIPPERKLAEELGVSRTVVREAMVYLELVGIAEIRQGSGVYVIGDEPSHLMCELPEVTPYEVTEARRALEPQLAALAAEKASTSLLAELAQCVALMEASQRFSRPDLRKSASVDADRQFHRLIALASDNPLLIQYHADLMQHHMRGTMWERLNILADEPAEKGVWIDDHRAIFAAIEAGDPERAAQAMNHHLLKVIAEIT